MNMLEKIQSQLEHLSKSERKVAEVILESPSQAIHSSIATLASERRERADRQSFLPQPRYQRLS
ncbi:Phosphogluconate repressor HexR, RpiR family [Cronobacter dublinensis 582]|nr:Phosphogluconate repressor HexR, RpiR family [Cronobacter dublinensis 582]